MLHRSISALVRLINGDRAISYLMICSIYLIGAALVGLIGHVTGFNAWLWTALPLNSELSAIDRAGGVAFFIGQYLMLGIGYVAFGYYKWNGERRYRTAMALSDRKSGGLSYGFGYWAFEVNGQSASSRFAPR